MTLFFCCWWVGDRTCGDDATRIIVDSHVPDRHVCNKHYEAWRRFISRKEAALCP